MGDASFKMEPYFRAYRKKYFRVIINLEKLMGNEELANRRHLLKMLVKQRITIEGGIQIVIELRGKRDVAIHYVKSMACEVKLK